MPRVRIRIAIFLILVSALTRAQDQGPSGPSAVDILGPHDSYGRGCGVCHTPHANILAVQGNEALWGSIGNPSYGQKLIIADIGEVAEVQPGKFATQTSEVNGVILCLSCHDGNLSPISMVVGEPYPQKMGLVPGAKHSRVHVVSDEAGNIFTTDHPLGAEATIEVGEGLKFSNGVFSVTPGTPYAEFVANYGWPTLAPMRRANPYGVDAAGRPYLVCTTCHNQHAMNVYHSRAGSRIAGDNGDQSYTSTAFVNGPYNMNARSVESRNATSGVQFCRQCHFHLTNEGNNTTNIGTQF